MRRSGASLDGAAAWAAEYARAVIDTEGAELCREMLSVYAGKENKLIALWADDMRNPGGLSVRKLARLAGVGHGVAARVLRKSRMADAAAMLAALRRELKINFGAIS